MTRTHCQLDIDENRFFCHFISYLWQKIAIVLAIFGHFLRLFSASDTVMLKRGAHSTWIYLTHVRSRIQAILGPLSHKSMAGRHQKWPIWDQKWPNMAGLPMSRCGPKGSQMVPNGQYNMFLTIWDIFGLIWTISDKTWFFAPKHLRHTHLGQKIHFCLKWPKRVQMGPKGSQMVKNT